jgi:hypothetical protein
MFYIVLVAAIITVILLTAWGRALFGGLLSALKPVVGIVIFLASAHHTIVRNFIISRDLIFPSLSKKTVHRDN